MSLLSPRFALIVPALALLALAGCGGAQSANKPASTALKSAPSPTGAVPSTPVVTGGSVAAIVNGRAVPISLYRSLLTLAERQSAGQPGVTVQSLAQQTMNEVIADALIEQYAAAHHITLSDSELNAQIQRDEAQTHGQKALQQALTRVGITFSTYKTLLRMNLLGQKVEKQVAPLNSKPELVAHVRHILIMLHPQGKPALTDAQAHAKAERILNQVQHGGNFAALARANSDDTGSAAQGGDLGNVYPGQTVPQFNQAAFALPLNHPALIHTVYGYHIVEVLSRRTQTPPLQSQQQAQQQAFSSWIDRQMKDASIKRLARVKA